MQANNRAGAAPKRLPLLRGIAPIAISLCVLWVLRDKITHIDVNAMLQTTLQIAPLSWLVAAILTAISFYAVAQYDRLVIALLQLSIPRRTSLAAGWRATAIAQVLGYGLVTGALTRWRALGRVDGVSLWDCSRLTAGVTLSFFAGWAVIASSAITLAPQDQFQGWPRQLAVIGLLLTLVAIIASANPPSKWARFVPSPKFMLPVVGFTALDTLAAAAVIFVFLPEGYVPFFVLYTAFLIALTAGMASGLPGGLGAFELCILALLNPVDPAPLLAAVLAFRMIYYATPAVIAGISLIHVPDPSHNGQVRQIKALNVPPHLTKFSPPEADLCIQNPLSVILEGNNGALWHRARNSDIVLGDPFGPTTDPTFVSALRDAAKRAGRGLCFYKCSSETLTISKMWSVKIGSEAVLKTSQFNLSGPARRQLRRKIRKAEKTCVDIAEGYESYETLLEIDQDWRDRNGDAHGFSMGYLSESLVERQRVFVARQNGQIMGFVTFLTGANKWTLDIMRMRQCCPEGVMHAAIVAAIDAANAEGVEHLSLAAAPGYLGGSPASPIERGVDAIFQRNVHLKGLAQFKASFGPEWQPRYMAASSIPTLAFAALDLWFLVRRPQAAQTGYLQTIHNDYGFYEFDSSLSPCHAHQRMTSKDAPHEYERSKQL